MADVGRGLPQRTSLGGNFGHRFYAGTIQMYVAVAGSIDSIPKPMKGSIRVTPQPWFFYFFLHSSHNVRAMMTATLVAKNKSRGSEPSSTCVQISVVYPNLRSRQEVVQGDINSRGHNRSIDYKWWAALDI